MHAWTMREEINRKLLVFVLTVLRRIAGVAIVGTDTHIDIRTKRGIHCPRNRDVLNRVLAKILSNFGHRTPKHIALWKSTAEKTSWK